MNFHWLLNAALLLAPLPLAADARADGGPAPPCAPAEGSPAPAYGAPGAPPRVAVWRAVTVEGDAACLGALAGRMDIVVALAASFRRRTTLDRLAARIGRISSTAGLEYWSATERKWRVLISETFALERPDARARRGDFSAAEILSGRPLFFAQADTRSTGTNVYSLRTLDRGSGGISVEIVNRSAVRFAFVTLMAPADLIAVHFVRPLRPGVWGYYGLVGLRNATMGGHEKSLINRAAAFYRFLAGIPANKEPPLAP